MSTVEYSMDQVNPPERRCQILQQAIERIDDLFTTLSESVNSCNNGYPSAQQLNAARAFGSTVSQWCSSRASQVSPVVPSCRADNFHHFEKLIFPPAMTIHAPIARMVVSSGPLGERMSFYSRQVIPFLASDGPIKRVLPAHESHDRPRELAQYLARAPSCLPHSLPTAAPIAKV
ncbi:hypothetical protein B0H11DRAFT_1920928 [Mycena galericulata]|nr:hypothetical protein B0H11DRAFT_1920928 [Mycena galericulata]